METLAFCILTALAILYPSPDNTSEIRLLRMMVAGEIVSKIAEEKATGISLDDFRALRQPPPDDEIFQCIEKHWNDL
ncbi:MAG: hypothetical protein GDA52_10445 [Rhodobacteraceae bacterium]|nr:hypothetical protein [Paracoccaceae bacterium]